MEYLSFHPVAVGVRHRTHTMSSLRSKLDRRRNIADKPSYHTAESDEEVADYNDDDDDDENDNNGDSGPENDKNGEGQPEEQEQSDSEIILEDDPEDLIVDEEGHGDSSDNDSPKKVNKEANKRPSQQRKPPPKKKAPDVREELEDDEPSSSEEEVNEDPKDDEDYHESSGDDDDDDDNDVDDDLDDEDFGTTARNRRKAPAKKKKKAPARSRAAAASKKKKTTLARSSNRKRSRVRYSSSEDEPEVDDDDDDDDDSGDFGAPSRRRGRNTAVRRASPRNRRGTARKVYKDTGSSDEDGIGDDSDDSDASGGRRKRTPSRASAAKATAKIAQINYKEVQLDSEEDDEPPVETRKSRKKNSDEEEFEDDNEQEVEDDELDGVAHSDESVTKADKRAVGNADNSDFAEDDVSDDDGGGGKPRALQNRLVRGAKRAAAKQRPEQYYSDSDENDDADEISPTKAGRRGKEKRSRSKSKNAPPKLPHCPSKVDEITNDPLPERHVCFISPDGQSRQCFALETLHKIANMTSHPQYRINLSGEQQRTFLQPPHFRSAMSDDLIDQVASRFGRQALDLDGDFYKRETGPAKVPSADAEEDLYQVTFEGALADEDVFLETWRDYQLRTMGSQDIYVCPLCYTVAHHRLTSTNRKNEIIPPSEFDYDPMTVLGYPDEEDFEIASAFCFKRITEVKQHLKEDHSVDPSVVGDSGLWQKFKVSLANHGSLVMLRYFYSYYCLIWPFMR